MSGTTSIDNGFFAEERPIPTAWIDDEGEDAECGPWFHDTWAYTDC